MTKLIFISGSVNAGKTTTSHELVALLPRTAHVRGDELRHFVTWLPLEEAIPITRQNIIAVAKNFLKNEFNVVVDYPLNQDEYEIIVKTLAPASDTVHAFVLSPRLEVTQRQRGKQKLSEAEVERIAYHYHTHMTGPGFSVQIDNSDLSAREGAELILENEAPCMNQKHRPILLCCEHMPCEDNRQNYPTDQIQDL